MSDYLIVKRELLGKALNGTAEESFECVRELRALIEAPAVVGDGREEVSSYSAPSCEDGYGFGYVDGTCIQSLRGYRDHLEAIIDSIPGEPMMPVAQHERIVASLTRPAQTEQLPVAWMYKYRDGTEIQTSEDRWTSKDWPSCWDETPLYAASVAQPAPLAIPDECPHMIVFDDAERENELFAGCGARPAAMRRFEQISQSWNAHLFVRIEKNSRDAPYPCATTALRPADGLVEAHRRHAAELIASRIPLVEALEPFAALADLFDDGVRGGTMPRTGVVMSWPRLKDGELVDNELTVEHLRAARAVLAAHRAGGAK